MKATVRKGYIVFYRNNKYEAGSEIPASILKEVVENQSWKLEVSDGKEKDKIKSSRDTDKTKEQEQEKEIRELVSDRMIDGSTVKKKG